MDMFPELNRLSPVASGRDEIEEGVDPVVPKTGVTLDARLFRENIVVLALEIAHDFLEANIQSLATRAGVDGGGLTQTRCQCYLQIQVCPRSSNQCERRPLRVLQVR